MKKKDFLKLIEENKDIFRCIILEDSTIRYGFPHSAIKIAWYTDSSNSNRTTVKTMRGKPTDIKCIEQFEKYKGWLESE